VPIMDLREEFGFRGFPDEEPPLFDPWSLEGEEEEVEEGDGRCCDVLK